MKNALPDPPSKPTQQLWDHSIDNTIKYSMECSTEQTWSIAQTKKTMHFSEKHRQQEFHAFHKKSMHSEVIPCIPQQLHAFYNVTFIGPSMLLLLTTVGSIHVQNSWVWLRQTFIVQPTERKRHTLLRSSVVVPLVSSTEHRKPNLGKVLYLERNDCAR